MFITEDHSPLDVFKGFGENIYSDICAVYYAVTVTAEGDDHLYVNLPDTKTSKDYTLLEEIERFSIFNDWESVIKPDIFILIKKQLLSEFYDRLWSTYKRELTLYYDNLELRAEANKRAFFNTWYSRFINRETKEKIKDEEVEKLNFIELLYDREAFFEDAYYLTIEEAWACLEHLYAILEEEKMI